MKSSKILDVIKVWIKKYGGKYKVIKTREGDRLDEYLIGFNEIDFTYKVKYNKKLFYIIDFDIKPRNPIKKIVSSKTSKKLKENEILELLKIGLK